MHDPLALQRLGQLADFGDQLAAADVGVVGERLVAYGDGLEHAAARYLTGQARASAIERSTLQASCARTRRAARADYGLARMLNGRLYRVAFLPLPARPRRGRVLARRPADAAHLDAGARRLRRRPGLRGAAQPRRAIPRPPARQRGRRALAAHIARLLRGLGGTAGGGFSVHVASSKAQTIDGERG